MTRKASVEPIHLSQPLLFRELSDAGIAPSRIRARDVTHPYRGVHVIGSAPTDLVARCRELAAILRRGEAFSHMTAASLVGAPLPSARETKLHVAMTGEADRMRRPGVVGHRATDLPLTIHLGLPIVEPVYVFHQLATQLSHDDLVAVGDFLVTPNRRTTTPALASIGELQAAIPARARGASRARRALADVRVGAESRMETLTRLLLVRAGLPEPELNPAVQTAARVLHPDIFYRGWRLILEYEGDGHRTDPKQWRRDIWRREAFHDAGYRVMQVHKEDVLAEPEQFLARVCHAIASRTGNG